MPTGDPYHINACPVHSSAMKVDSCFYSLCHLPGILHTLLIRIFHRDKKHNYIMINYGIRVEFK